MHMDELAQLLGAHNYLDMGRCGTATIDLTRQNVADVNQTIPEKLVALCNLLEDNIDEDEELDDYEAPLNDILGSEYIEQFKSAELRGKTIPITSDWALAVAYLQEVAYRNTEYIESLVDMLNAIGAAALANNCLGHRLNTTLNLSVLAFNKKGTPAGYLLAYAARADCRYPGLINKGEPIIYVHDIAVQPDMQGQGIAKNLIECFISEWAKADRPVLADVRKDTSYPMLQHLANKGILNMYDLEDEGDMIKVMVKLPQ